MMNSKLMLAGFLAFLALVFYIGYSFWSRIGIGEMKKDLEESKTELDEALKKLEKVNAEAKKRIEGEEKRNPGAP